MVLEYTLQVLLIFVKYIKCIKIKLVIESLCVCPGSDIMMQLDDVVSSTVTGPRVEEAMHRSIRWLDRCIAANQNPDKQNLFAIIQGGLNAELRKTCLDGKMFFSNFIPPSHLINWLPGLNKVDFRTAIQ